MNKLFFLTLITATLIASCKKTDVVPYPKEPTNHILSYIVANAPDSLQAVIDNVDNTITVYSPYYLSINFIAPKITLEDSATLIDKNGNKIDIREDLDPVPFDSVGYTYRVRDNKNNIRTYTLVTKILPYKDKLTMGYSVDYDGNTGKDSVNYTAPAEAKVNSQILLFGNLESLSKNAKLTLVSKTSNAVVPNALSVVTVERYGDFPDINVQISAAVDSGYYYIIVEHQGRTDTLPAIHLYYIKPQFDYLPKTCIAGDTMTLNVQSYQGVNTGITRMYIKLKKGLFTQGAYTAPNFPDNLFDVPIEVKIVSQSRTQIRFIFPDLPKGVYSNYISSSSSDDGTYNAILKTLDASFGLYFDFSSEEWGNDNLLSAGILFEVK